MTQIEEILESRTKLAGFLEERGFSVNSTYTDGERPNAIFLNIADDELLAIDECGVEEVRTVKTHFLVDRGLTHCAILNSGRLFFYRNFGEVRYFAFSKRTISSPSKIDKLKRVGENIDILFELKDVSNNFYETFKQKRNMLVRAIGGDMDNTRKYLIAQKIFDRIFFIYFLCHKGLVRFQDGRVLSGATLFGISMERGGFTKNLYKVFNSFNREDEGIVAIGDYRVQLPFLNGGLFRLDSEEVDLRVTLQSSDWQSIFDFLDSYHWIIEDDVEEIEHEKILTPEILGHVYERSVVEWEKKGFKEEVAEASGQTERKTKGVYYTPEEVTDFICKSSIHPNLLSKLAKNFSDVRELVIKGTAEDLQSALQVLDSITVLDPACGSGAFLIKSADIIFQLRCNLLSKLGRKPDYYRIKLEIITRNIYGVDILEGATEIAKLRLWLWLVSSYSDREEITPLPNIEYNIVVGNSLIGWTNEKFAAALDIPLTEGVSRGLDDGLRRLHGDTESLAKARELLKSYELANYVLASSLLYDAYKNAHGAPASALKSLLTELRKAVYQTIDQVLLNDVNKALPRKNRFSVESLNTMTFHWGYDFGNIMGKAGFDVIIGNPPYISNWTLSRINREEVEYLTERFSAITTGHWDLYIIFIMRSLSLLKDNGYLSFIVPSSFSKEKYGKALRELIIRKYSLNCLVDFGTEAVFSEVARQYEIFVIRNKSDSENVTDIMRYDKGDFRQSGSIKQKEFLDFHNCTFRTDVTEVDIGIKKKISKDAILLGLICCINPGVVAHSREGSPIEFSKDDVIHNRYSKGYVKYVDGKEISRYNIHWGGQFMDYRSKAEYFHRPKFPELFEREKIIVRRISGENNSIVLALDEDHFYTNDNLLHLIPWDDDIVKLQSPGKLHPHKPYGEFRLTYLAAIVGSKLMSYYFSKFFATGTLQGTYSGIYPEDLRQIPIRTTVKSQRDKLSELAEKMVRLNKALNEGPSGDSRMKIESELSDTDKHIDELVYRIYDITETEKEVVENGMKGQS